jgi:AraC-like DNA-binding protein
VGRFVAPAEVLVAAGVKPVRLLCGTSPYRYLLMRHLDFARAQISRHRPLVDVALEADFADQAHFTRMFKAAFGITPARYGALRAQNVHGKERRCALEHS